MVSSRLRLMFVSCLMQTEGKKEVKEQDKDFHMGIKAGRH